MPGVTDTTHVLLKGNPLSLSGDALMTNPEERTSLVVERTFRAYPNLPSTRRTIDPDELTLRRIFADLWHWALGPPYP